MGLGFGLWFVYMNSLSKILVCGADDTVYILDLCLCLFVLLNLFYLLFGGVRFCCFWVLYFVMSDLVYFFDCNIVTLNGRSIVMMFLFD